MVKRLYGMVDSWADVPWLVRAFALLLIVCGPLQLAWTLWDQWQLLTVRLNKIRTDCSFSDDRWIEPLIPPPGEALPRVELGGARAQWVTARGESTILVRINLPDDLPAGVWVLRTVGVYSCRDGLYPSDPLEVRFTLPPA